MSDPTNVGMPSDRERMLEQENRRLRDRVGDLEDELSRGQRAFEPDEYTDDVEEDRRYLRARRRRLWADRDWRELPTRALDQSARLYRGMVLAVVEVIQTVGRCADVFGEEVFRRNRASVRAMEEDADEALDHDEESYPDLDRVDDPGDARRTAPRPEDEVRARRRRRIRRTTAMNLAMDLPGDLLASIVDGVEEAMDMSDRAASRLSEVLRESSSPRARYTRTERRRGRKPDVSSEDFVRTGEKSGRPGMNKSPDPLVGSEERPAGPEDKM